MHFTLTRTGGQLPESHGAAVRAIVGFNHRVWRSRGRDTPAHWIASELRFAPKASGKDERPLHLLDSGGKNFYDAVLAAWTPYYDPAHTAFRAGWGGRDAAGEPVWYA